jgi:hypothetical protein
MIAPDEREPKEEVAASLEKGLAELGALERGSESRMASASVKTLACAPHASGMPQEVS